MALLGQAVVAIWNDISAQGRDEFHEWHAREHMPERLSIPGFRRGRRYASASADIEFYTLYEADSLGVITGPDYKAKLNAPTPWSTRTVEYFRNNLRGICRVAYSAGQADGAFMSTIRLAPQAGQEERLERSLVDTLLPPLLGKPRICGVHLAITDPSLSGTRTKLQSTRTIVVPDWAVMIEGGSGEAVEKAAGALAGALSEAGAMADAIQGVYQLEYGITKTSGN